MQYVNDININEAIIHILDNNAVEPILNNYKLELEEDTYKFLYKHIEKCLNDEELKYAKFSYERNVVKEIAQDYLNGTDSDFISISKELARQLFSIMKGNVNIPSCDLIITSIITDQGPMIAILKMDYVNNFTQKEHALKILPEYFEDVVIGKKTFELRKNDRGFALGDRYINFKRI